jgi:hypothetical protein
MSYRALFLSVAVACCSTACGDDDDDVVATIDASVIDGAVAIDARIVIDATPAVDARPADLSCLGETPPVPKVIPDPLVIAGKTSAITASGLEDLPGAIIEARDLEDVVQATATSDKAAAYEISVPSGGNPLVGVLRVTAPDHIPGRLQPFFPLTASIPSLSLQIFPVSLLNLLQVFADFEQLPANGWAVMQVEDCAGDEIVGATVTVGNPNADTQVIYVSEDQLPDETLTATTSAGLVFIFNLTPGPVTLEAKIGASTLRYSPIRAVAGETSLGQILP